MSTEFSYQVPCEGSCTSGSSVTFEVISAEVIREGRSGHVVSFSLFTLNILFTFDESILRRDKCLQRERLVVGLSFCCKSHGLQPVICDTA